MGKTAVDTSNTATGVTVSSVSIGAITTTLPGALIVFVTVNASYVVAPVVTVKADGVDLFFIGSANSSVGNLHVEMWAIDARSLSSTSVTATVVDFGGALVTVLATAISARQTSGSIGPTSSGNSGTGITSPATCSLTWDFPLVNAKSTVQAPFELGSYIACVCMFRAGGLSELTITSGSSLVAPTTVGLAGLQTQSAIGILDATSGTDTITWTESVNREWVVLMYELSPSAVSTPIQHRTTPTFY